MVESAPAGPSPVEARSIAAALVAEQPAPSSDGPALPGRASAELAGRAELNGVPPTAGGAAGASPVQPQALKPQAPQKRQPPKVAPSKPTRTPRQGDLVCGTCGEVNPSARKFCSRCGTSLAAAVVVKISWIKRAFARKPKVAMAGERPWESGTGAKKRKKRQGLGKLIVPARRIISVALVALGLLYGVYSPFRNWVNDKYTSAKDSVLSVVHPEYLPVTAGPGTTSNEPTPLDPAHPASAATDGFKNTYWLTNPPSEGFRPELDVQLTEQTDIDKIIVHNGASDDFQGFHRPKTLLFVFDNGNEYEVGLKNTPDPQTVSIEQGGGVQRFKIAVTDVYESIDGTAVALTEIEFFTEQ